VAVTPAPRWRSGPAWDDGPVQTTHPRPQGWFQIPPNFADMTDAERDEWSRAVDRKTNGLTNSLLRGLGLSGTRRKR